MSNQPPPSHAGWIIASPMDSAARTRWIIIGEVERCFVRIRNWGVTGYCVKWRGSVSWPQPVEFAKWDDVLWAIRKRLEIAGLALVDVRCPMYHYSPVGSIETIQCQVRRAQSGRKSLKASKALR